MGRDVDRDGRMLMDGRCRRLREDADGLGDVDGHRRSCIYNWKDVDGQGGRAMDNRDGLE